MNRKFLYLACLTMLSAQGADLSDGNDSSDIENFDYDAYQNGGNAEKTALTHIHRAQQAMRDADMARNDRFKTAAHHYSLVPEGTQSYQNAQHDMKVLEAAGCEPTFLDGLAKTGGVTALLLVSSVCVKEALQENSALYAGGATISALGACFLYQSNFSLDPDKNSVTENLALSTAISAGLGVGLGAPLYIAAQYYN